MSNYPPGIPIPATAVPDSTATHHAADWFTNVTKPISDAFGWLTGDNDWQTLTLANSWVPFGGDWATAQFRTYGKFVFMRGLVKSGTPGLITTLPAPYRPVGGQQIFSVFTGNHGMTNLVVNTGGGITLGTYLGGGNNAFVDLSPIRFMAD